MATREEIIRSFRLLAGAGLEFAPRQDEIDNRLNSWCELLTDIPGPILIQSARDLAATSQRFPSVAQVRKTAERVKANNGRSTAGGQFTDPSRERALRAWRVTPDGWKPLTADGRKPEPLYPPEVMGVIVELEEKYYNLEDGLPTDEEFERLEILKQRYS